jgi:predicted N-acyltransferase
VVKRLKTEFISSLAQVDSADWNALVDDNEPFLRHEFLSALELSESVSKAKGWQSHHFICTDNAGELLAVSPMYLKYHSYGEYVFDWAWADAYQRHGLSYYPKLISAIPFTPSQSRRLLMPALVSPARQLELSRVFQNVVEQECKRSGLSSAHVLFPSAEQVKSKLFKGWMERRATQYHWFNRSYTNFEDFLTVLKSSKRKNIRKERKTIANSGITTQWYRVDELSNTLRECFYSCYENTYHQRGQHAYLNRAFFDLLFDTMPQACLLLFAFNGAGKAIACSLFLKGSETLYGRYWGCIEEVPCLHFELCYYQGIEYCIKHKLHCFDAGAQGEHKLLRGFEPQCTFSYHLIQHAEFAHAIDRFLEEEKEHVEQYREDAKSWLPYKNAN